MADESQAAPDPKASDPRRQAAACIERSLECYAEGRYAEALAELEAALAAQAGHARATEFLAWVREVAAGRRVLTSGSFTAVSDEVEASEAATSEAATSEAEPQPKKGGTLLGLPALERLTGESGAAALESVEAQIQAHAGAPPAGSQVDETPESVTREWAMMSGGALPPLETGELTDEQIANLLDAEAGRGLTLSKNAVLPGVAPPPIAASPPVVASASPLDDDAAADDDAEDEADPTGVRFLQQSGEVVEMVADAEDDEDAFDAPAQTSARGAPADDPLLTPLQSAEDRPRTTDQTTDDASSLPTNPFVHQRLREVAPALIPAAPVLDEPAVADAAWAAVHEAVERGVGREAFDAAERAIGAQGSPPRVGEEEQTAVRAYELFLGDLQAVPRFGKTTPDLDSRSAFLLSRIDGTTNADDVLDVSGMPRLEALRVLARLVADGVVVLKK